MKKFRIFLFVFLVYLFAPSISFSEKLVELPNHKVSMKADEVGLRDALNQLLANSNLEFRLSNNITNDKKVSIDVQEVPWSEAFRFMVQEGRLNFRVTSKNKILVSPYK